MPHDVTDHGDELAAGLPSTGQRLDDDGHLGHTIWMSIEAWWPKLSPVTRDWLIANNGDVVPPALIEEIAVAGGPPESDGWWVSEDGSTRVSMPDQAIDWIEEIANEETPEG